MTTQGYKDILQCFLTDTLLFCLSYLYLKCIWIDFCIWWGQNSISNCSSTMKQPSFFIIQVIIYVCIYSQILYSVSLFNLSILVPIPHCFNYYSFTMNLDIQCCSLQCCLGISIQILEFLCQFPWEKPEPLASYWVNRSIGRKLILFIYWIF